MGLIIFIIPSALKQSFTLFGWLWLVADTDLLW